MSSAWARALLVLAGLGAGLGLALRATLTGTDCGPAVEWILNDTESAILLYQAKHKGELPPDLEAARPYLRDQRLPRDDWGTPLIYQPTPDGSGYLLMSLGEDRQPGGDGLAADWVRWRGLGLGG